MEGTALKAQPSILLRAVRGQPSRDSCPEMAQCLPPSTCPILKSSSITQKMACIVECREGQAWRLGPVAHDRLSSGKPCSSPSNPAAGSHYLLFARLAQSRVPMPDALVPTLLEIILLSPTSATCNALSVVGVTGLDTLQFAHRQL